MEYKKCLVQVDEILKYLSNEDLEKIPYEIRESIKEERDTEYIWNYDESKSLTEQNIDRKTIVLLSYLNMEFLLNDEQKLLMKEMHTFNDRKLEKEKRKKYNLNDIFKNISMNNISNNNTKEKLELVVYKKNIFKKILNKLKSIFKIGV